MSELMDRLRGIVSKATPGPWFANVNDLVGGWWVNDYNVNAASAGPHVVGVADMPSGPDDANHIATFDPVLVAAMLDVIDALTEDAGFDGTCKCKSPACVALARFREVVDEQH